MQNIEVLAAFSKEGGLVPKVVRFGEKLYRVANVSLAHTVKRGASKIMVFNVSDEAESNHWTLIYDTENLLWKIENSLSF